MGKFLNGLSNSIKALKSKMGKKTQFLLAGILALIMLIIFFNGIKGGGTETKPQTDNINTQSKDIPYTENLEQRLEKILASIDGIGEVNAFVMTETSVRTIYVGDEEEKTSGDNSSTTKSLEIVFEKNGSVSTPIVSLEIYPEITGVLIVAEGTNDEKLRLLVINAVSVALGIENSKIEVLVGKKG